jgi:hypothetical protein
MIPFLRFLGNLERQTVAQATLALLWSRSLPEKGMENIICSTRWMTPFGRKKREDQDGEKDRGN